MFINAKYFFIFATLLMVSVSTNAGTYFGVKMGPMNMDIHDTDAPFNFGIVFGSNDTGWSFEGEMTASASEGEYTLLGNRVEAGIKTIAAYGAYRSAGKSYLKFKYGFLSDDNEFAFVEDSYLDSAGLGVGWRLGEGVMLEVEYTLIATDVDFLSLGVNF